MKPDLHISFNLGVLDNQESPETGSRNMDLRKLFSTRLSEFVSSHPEVCIIFRDLRMQYLFVLWSMFTPLKNTILSVILNLRSENICYIDLNNPRNHPVHSALRWGQRILNQLLDLGNELQNVSCSLYENWSQMWKHGDPLILLLVLALFPSRYRIIFKANALMLSGCCF